MPGTRKRTVELPRSTLSTLHEPFYDPRDGHGARSKHDLMIRQMWEVAKTGGKEGDAALDALLDLIARDDLAKIKRARGKVKTVVTGGPPYKVRSLIPVMIRLRMIESETVSVSPERDGYATVSTRQKITLVPWLAGHALEHPDADPEAVSDVLDWLVDGGIQRPFRMAHD